MRINLPKIPASQITEKTVYQSRRSFLKTSLAVGTSLAVAASSQTQAATKLGRPAWLKQDIQKSIYSTEEKTNTYKEITSYNNFYEFGTSKHDPAKHSGNFKPLPWSIAVTGECENPGTVSLEDLLKPHTIEERIYRLRCVEGWSMVIPWLGVTLGSILKKYKPTSRAKYVELVTVYRPTEMPGQRLSILRWPYKEALRIDEAMHPLTILTVGLYGEMLPNQNGAPLRLIVPWKYGFKSVKSVVQINFTEQPPRTTWNVTNPREYGFYANVNPMVDHPRWSQAKERRIGEFFKRDTEMFNGYGEWVASLYQGMDLMQQY